MAERASLQIKTLHPSEHGAIAQVDAESRKARETARGRRQDGGRQEGKPNRYKKDGGKSSGKDFDCRRCATRHLPKSCPAFGQTCLICKQKGHFARVCKAKVHVVMQHEEGEEDSCLLYTSDAADD